LQQSLWHFSSQQLSICRNHCGKTGEACENGKFLQAAVLAEKMHSGFQLRNMEFGL
jgi:hypothetical protein